MGKKAVKLYLRTVTCILSLVFLTLSIVAFKAGTVSPHITVSYQFIILASPAIIIVNLALFIWWSVRKKIWLLVPLAGLVFNYKFFLTIVGLNSGSLSFPLQNKVETQTITVASYNVNYFFYKDESKLTSIAKMVSGYEPDVLCLQEVQPHPLFNLDEIKKELEFLPYSFIHIGDHNEIGMALFSRYPIIRAEKTKFPDSGNGVMWADILFRDDTLRVFNNHLQTTSLSRARGKRATEIIKTYSENYKRRASQAEYVRKMIDSTLFPVILCGDFNDTPQSYAYKTVMGDDLIDGFTENGTGLGGTYRNTLGLVRIDYIFHSGHFKARFYKSNSKGLSDHKAVISVLEYQN